MAHQTSIYCLHSVASVIENLAHRLVFKGMRLVDPALEQGQPRLKHLTRGFSSLEQSCRYLRYRRFRERKRITISYKNRHVRLLGWELSCVFSSPNTPPWRDPSTYRQSGGAGAIRKSERIPSLRMSRRCPIRTVTSEWQTESTNRRFFGLHAHCLQFA